MFANHEVDCKLFENAKKIINQDLLSSDNDTIFEKTANDLFEIGEEIARKQFSNSIKVDYFHLLLAAYRDSTQERAKKTYAKLIVNYRAACTTPVQDLILKEIEYIKQKIETNDLNTKLTGLRVI